MQCHNIIIIKQNINENQYLSMVIIVELSKGCTKLVPNENNKLVSATTTENSAKNKDNIWTFWIDLQKNTSWQFIQLLLFKFC